MSDQTAQKQRYMVSIYEPEEASGTLIFTLVPNGLQKQRGAGGTPKRASQFIVSVRQAENELAFDWSGTSDDPSAVREEVEAEIAARMKDRKVWIDRVNSLVSQVDQWAKEIGWATRRVEKKLEDTQVGKHRVPALLMQQETCRALLEPIGRSSPGAEGVVDLYLLPAYDDVASLYFYNDQWNLHYNAAHGSNGAVSKPTAEAMPLTKQTLEKVLAEMRRNAA